MQALKGLVIGMGVLIVAGMVLLVYGLYQKANDPDFKFFSLNEEKSNVEQSVAPPVANSPTVTRRPQSSFGNTAIPLALGDSLVSMIAEDNRLIMHIRNSSGSEKVVITDMNRGTLLGTFDLKAAR
jgi:hypothetical protein